MIKYTIRKTELNVICPHCNKQFRIGVALMEKNRKIHRGEK